MRPVWEEPLDRHAKERARLALSLGPWCWPSEASPALAEVRRGFDGLEVPSGGRAVPVVTVSESAATLWAAVPHRDESGATLGPRALRAWDDAVVALPRSVGLLWAAVSPHRSRPPSLLKVVSRPLFKSGVPEATVDGPSVGLAFVIALVSRVTGLPVPDDLLASAAIDAEGGLASVGRLDVKARLLMSVAPRIRRFLVAASQEAEAQAAMHGSGVEVVPARSVGEAVALVFGDALAEALVGLGATVRGRSELVEALLRLALRRRAELVDWSPVERAAGLALERFSDLTEDQRMTLVFVRSVAARHERNEGLPPGQEWFERRPLAVRVEALAHLAQQCADAGVPAWAEVEKLVAPYLPGRTADAFPVQLKLAGARARCLAVNGRPREALEAQEEIARATVGALLDEEASYPLAEWFRLTGACGDAASRDRAEQVFRQIAERGALEGGRAYVELSRARALVALGPAQDALEPLQGLAADARLPKHVRLSARRWTAKALRAVGDRASAERVLEDLRRDLEGAPKEDRVFLLLSEIDAALGSGEVGRAPTALAALAEAAPGLAASLRRAAPPEVEAEYVGRFYPY